MQDNQEYKTEELINQILEEEPGKEINISVALEIAERLQQSRRKTRDSLEYLRQAFKNKNSDIILNAVLLFEALVKNCNEHFHYEVDDSKFQETFFSLLKKKRGKANLVDKMLAKEKNWKLIENKVLYLYQLWADTFMMVEDEYPNLMNYYKKLRKEGITFPARDPSEKFMIKYNGAKSPIFEVLDDVAKREQEEERKRIHNLHNYERQKKGLAPKKYISKEEEDELDRKTEQYKQPSIQISQNEIDSIKENMQLLLALMASAQKYDDLNTEFTAEIVENITKTKDKISKAYKFKQFKNENHKALCIDTYQESKNLLKNFEERASELEQLEKVLQESALEEIKIQKNKSDQKKKSDEEQQQEEQKQNDNIDLLDIDNEPIQQQQPQSQNQNNQPQNNQQQNNTNTGNNADNDLLDLFDAPPQQQQQQQQPQQQQFQQNVIQQNQIPLNQNMNGFNQNQQQMLGNNANLQQNQNIQIQQQMQQMNLNFNNQQKSNIPQQQQQQQSQNNNQDQELDDLFGDSANNNNNQQQQNQNNNLKATKEDDDDDFFDDIANR